MHVYLNAVININTDANININVCVWYVYLHTTMDLCVYVCRMTLTYREGMYRDALLHIPPPGRALEPSSDESWVAVKRFVSRRPSGYKRSWRSMARRRQPKVPGRIQVDT